jgi:hypothetical protein
MDTAFREQWNEESRQNGVVGTWSELSRERSYLRRWLDQPRKVRPARPLAQIHDLYYNTYVRALVGCRW